MKSLAALVFTFVACMFGLPAASATPSVPPLSAVISYDTAPQFHQRGHTGPERGLSEARDNRATDDAAAILPSDASERTDTATPPLDVITYNDRAQLVRIAAAAPTTHRHAEGNQAEHSSLISERVAANAGTDLVRAANFADRGAAFRHYSKHVKGIELRPNGGYRLKPGGADMPEFGSFAEYQSAARGFMTPDAPAGVMQGYRGTDLIRLDPKTGYFGVRSQDGTIRTFFRPDGDPVAYFRSQFQ